MAPTESPTEAPTEPPTASPTAAPTEAVGADGGGREETLKEALQEEHRDMARKKEELKLAEANVVALRKQVRSVAYSSGTNGRVGEGVDNIDEAVSNALGSDLASTQFLEGTRDAAAEYGHYSAGSV